MCGWVTAPLQHFEERQAAAPVRTALDSLFPDLQSISFRFIDPSINWLSMSVDILDLLEVNARWLLRTDPELALFGRYVVSKRLQDEEFQFSFPQLDGALNDLLKHHAGKMTELRVGRKPRLVK